MTDIRAVEMEAGRFGRLVERPRARVFDAFSDKGNGYTVTLNARPEMRPGDGDVCTCLARGECYHIAAARLRAAKVAAAATVPDGWTIEPEHVASGVIRYELRGDGPVSVAGTTYPASRVRAREAFVERSYDPQWGPGDEWLSSDALKARAALYLALAEDLDRRAAAA